MILFLIALLSMIFLFSLPLLIERQRDRRILRTILIPLTVILLLASLIVTIPTGFVGIPVMFGRVQNESMDAGLHLTPPWVSVVKMDNREQRIQFSTAAFSKDIQEVRLSGSVNIMLAKAAAPDLYSNVGTRYTDTLVMPQIMESLKSSVSKRSAEELIADRDALSTSVKLDLEAALTSYGITVTSVAIEDIDFTDSYTDAVEAKQVAAQELLRATTLQNQMTMEAQNAAERTKIAAEAEAAVARTKADAEAYAIAAKAKAEAEANKAIEESLTMDILQYMLVNRWDGKLPSFYTGDGIGIPEIQLNME